MKVHEYQAKKKSSPSMESLLKGILYVVQLPVQLLLTGEWDPDRGVIKAQVLTGGRGKAGGVKLVDNTEDAYQEAKNILSMSIKGLPVNQILVSEAVDIAAEYYVSFLLSTEIHAL